MSSAVSEPLPNGALLGDMSVRSHQRLPLRIETRGARGRGVVADAAIAPGQLIERSPVLIIPEKDRVAADGTIVFTYVFMWEHDTTEEDLYSHTGRSAIALGYTSLLNHSYDPNCSFIRHIDDLAIDLVAARPIAAGEELTIDYQMTLWFKPE
jgi:SET domain-containing protein